MRPWRKRLFMAMARNARDPVEFFGLSDDRVVKVGARVSI